MRLIRNHCRSQSVYFYNDRRIKPFRHSAHSISTVSAFSFSSLDYIQQRQISPILSSLACPAQPQANGAFLLKNGQSCLIKSHSKDYILSTPQNINALPAHVKNWKSCRGILHTTHRHQSTFTDVELGKGGAQTGPTVDRGFATKTDGIPAPALTRRDADASERSTSGVLAGKRCLITGASRGIGKAIAKRFAEEGAQCTLVGRNTEALYEAVEELRAVNLEGGSADHAHRVAIGDVGDAKFWEGIRKELSRVDILVSCAGIAHYSPLLATSTDSLDKILQTNLMGTILGCKTIGRGMIKIREVDIIAGCIINIASLLGLKGGKGSAAYAASKAGVIGLTRALAAELGEKNIRVNAIVPGYIETAMTEAMTPEARSAALNSIPLKRFGEPSEIADAAVFLATNRYASNCVLNLDGGLSAL